MKRRVDNIFIILIIYLICGGMVEKAAGTKAADLVINNSGQSNFLSPYAVAIHPSSGKVFVSDHTGSRVLRFDPPLTSSSTAAVVFGQTSFTATGKNAGFGSLNPKRYSLNYPSGIFVDSFGTLWVADFSNSRVMWWKNAHTTSTNGVNADGVIGNFTSPFPGTTANLLRNPNSVFIHNDTLWVVDTLNYRVMRWDNANSLTSYAAANGVIGQPDFYTNNPGNTASTFNDPRDIFVNNQGVYVADQGNSRVLYFTNAQAHLTTGGTASKVIGQTTLTGTGAGVTPSPNKMSSPYGITVVPDGSIYISDDLWNRVAIYPPPSPPTSNGVFATGVLGQSDLYSSASGSATTEMISPKGVFYHSASDTVWVADTANTRILRFSNITSTNASADTNNPNITVFQLDVTNQGPKATVLPKDNSGNVYPSLKEVAVHLYFIEEVDVNGKQVLNASLPFEQSDPGQQFSVRRSHSGKEIGWTYSKRLVIQATLWLEFTLQSGTPDDYVRLALYVDGWPFSSVNNKLRLHMLVVAQPDVPSYSQSSIGGGFTSFLLNSAEMSTKINLRNWGIANNNTATQAPVSFALTSTGFDVYQNVTLYEVTIDIPHFSNNFWYDAVNIFASLIYQSTTTSANTNSNGSSGSANSSASSLSSPLSSLLSLFCVF